MVECKYQVDLQTAFACCEKATYTRNGLSLTVNEHPDAAVRPFNQDVRYNLKIRRPQNSRIAEPFLTFAPKT